jgi:serine/threonine protein phosphatase PrpC
MKNRLHHLNCGSDSDGEYFAQDNISLRYHQDLTLSVEVCTIAGDSMRQNEDAFAVIGGGSSLTVGVFDGTTALMPESAKLIVHGSGGRFASHHLRDEMLRLSMTSPLTDVLRKLNGSLEQMFVKMNLPKVDERAFAGATATLARIDWKNRRLQIMHVGDSFMVLFKSTGKSDYLTPNTNAKFDEQAFNIVRAAARSKNITFRAAMEIKSVRDQLAEIDKRKNNRPDGKGTGLLNGDDNALLYVCEKEISLESCSSFLVGTDGLLPVGYALENVESRNKLREMLIRGGLREIVDKKKAGEDGDPDWKYPRYKHSDDGTGIFVKISATET